MKEDITLLITFPNNSRLLKKIINKMLHKGVAKSIKRVNYTKSYELINKKVEKKEEKLVFINTDNSSLEKTKEFIRKNMSESQILGVFKNYSDEAEKHL